MPAPGDQHTSIANPFNEPQPRISEYTAQEIATLQARLEKQLGPEYISSRAGPSGQKVHYITAEKCIALANEVFGFNGWSSSIQNIQVDFVDENPQTLRISLGLSVIVRVTLRDGTYHEDLGYGHIENCKGKAAAFEKAKKEGTTDALKRALRHFGNVLGNCIYDKAYLAKVTRMKVTPTKFDESCLHRHPDFVKKEPAESEAPKTESGAPPMQPPQLPSAESFEDFLGELDEADFNITDEGHPDEVVLPNPSHTDSDKTDASHKSHDQAGSSNNKTMQPSARPLVRTGSAGNNPPRQAPQTPVQQPARPGTNAFPGAQQRGPIGGGSRPAQQLNQSRPAVQPNSNSNQNPQAHMTPPNATTSNAAASGVDTVGFFSARAVKHIPEEALKNEIVAPKPGQNFNPRLESPSIRRTPGIDHTKSKPLAKNGQHVPPKLKEDDAATSTTAATNNVSGPGRPPPQQQQQQQPRPGPAGLGRPANVVNPQLDQTRRIGVPVSSSPLANRGQYRPPTMMKRPAGGDGPGPGGGGSGNGNAGRAPLADVLNHVASVAGGAGGGGVTGPEAKRQRIS